MPVIVPVSDICGTRRIPIMIYILEDDDNIRKLVSYALSREGYEVRGIFRTEILLSWNG